MGRFVFKLPDIGEGLAEAEVVAWHVAPGDTVSEDQPLVELMTEKATVEIPSPVSGRVVQLHGNPGQRMAIGSPLVEFETASAPGVAEMPGREATPTPTAAPSESSAHTPPEPAKARARAPIAQPSPARVAEIIELPAAETRSRGKKPIAAPAVRRRAWELGVPLQAVTGTGPGGRIRHDDLDAYVASQAGVARAPETAAAGLRAERDGVEEVRVVGLRRTIAERLADVQRRIPHFSYIEEVDVTELEELRAHLNASVKQRPKLTLLPFLITAMVRALRDHPQINARFDDAAGVLHRHAAVHAGIATQTSAGLMVPVLRHAEARGLWDLAAEIARLAEAARAGRASREELSGSTITITSLGALGGIAATPILNAPEVAIVGVNKIAERPVVRAGAIVVRKMMNLSSSFDHRIVDGWDAAEFIQRVKGILEHPAALFIAE